jgi:Ca2+-binding RTX toxin-like protein
MGPLLLLALFSGLMLSTMTGSDSADVTPDGQDTPEEPDEPEVPIDTQTDTDADTDIGATFSQTQGGVEIDVGEDETGTPAVIYYQDTEDNSADFVEVDEARFYLVPEGTDWSSASWETRGDVPGEDEYDGEPRDYELAEFEEQFGLKLLGVVDLKGIPSDSEEPGDRVGEIVSNKPVAGYFLTAATDGDDLVSFLPEDYIVTREGVPETPVFEDTTGTDETDWLSADADGITVDGAGGNDILATDNADVTLIGGLGNDTIESGGANVVVDGGAGDDYITARSATVGGGVGDDRISITSGTANGGEGDDRLVSYGDGPSLLYGDAGNDSASVSGAESQAYGGAGDDFIGVDNGAAGYGGAGDDRIQLDAGTTGNGGAGDDLFTVWNQFRDNDGPAVVTTGEGADTIDARVWNAVNGEADDIYLRVTDFDTAEDVLQVGVFQTGNEVDDVEIVEAEDGSHTDIRVTYTALAGLDPGVAVIRLEGTTGVTAGNLVITG